MKSPRALRFANWSPRGFRAGRCCPLTQNGAPAQMPAAGDVLAFEALRGRALNKGTNDRGREYENGPGFIPRNRGGADLRQHGIGKRGCTHLHLPSFRRRIHFLGRRRCRPHRDVHDQPSH